MISKDKVIDILIVVSLATIVGATSIHYHSLENRTVCSPNVKKI